MGGILQFLIVLEKRYKGTNLALGNHIGNNDYVEISIDCNSYKAFILFYAFLLWIILYSSLQILSAKLILWCILFGCYLSERLFK